MVCDPSSFAFEEGTPAWWRSVISIDLLLLYPMLYNYIIWIHIGHYMSIYIYTQYVIIQIYIQRERDQIRLDYIYIIYIYMIYIYMLHPQSCGFSMLQIFLLIPDIPGPHLCEWFLDWHGTCPTQRHLGSPVEGRAQILTPP